MSYPIKLVKQPYEFVSVNDWNSLIQFLQTTYFTGGLNLQKYYQNGSISGVNKVKAKELLVNYLEINGAEALWNNKQVLAEYIAKIFFVLQNWGQITTPNPYYKFVPYFSVQAKQLEYTYNIIKELYNIIPNYKLLIRLLLSKVSTLVPPQEVIGFQRQISGSISLQNLLIYPNLWREIIIKNLGTNPLYINTYFPIKPNQCVKITVSNPSSVTLSSTQTYVSVLESVSATPQTAYAITITNNQNSPTPSPFQQLLVLNLSGIISSPSQLLNLLFSSDLQGNTPLYAWVEQYSSNLSSVYIWVLLPNGVPANSSVTIYMHIKSIAQYPYTGVNSMLQCASIPCTPNASNDNGANVFFSYANFLANNGGFTGGFVAGSFTPAWSQGQGWQLMTLAGGQGTYIFNNQQLPLIPLTAEVIAQVSGSADGISAGFYSAGAPNTYNGGHGETPVNTAGSLVVESDEYFNGNAWYLNGTDEGGFGSFAPGYIFWKIVFQGSGSALGALIVNTWANGNNLINVPQYGSPPYGGSVSINYTVTNKYWWLGAQTGGSSDYVYVYWYRIRATPPNNVMPTNTQPSLVTYYTA